MLITSGIHSTDVVTLLGQAPADVRAQVSLDGITVQLTREPSRFVRSLLKLLGLDSILPVILFGVVGGLTGITLNVLLYTLLDISSQVTVLQQAVSLVYLFLSLLVVISLINIGMSLPDALYRTLTRSTMRKVSTLLVGPHEVRVLRGGRTRHIPLSSLRALDTTASAAVLRSGECVSLGKGCSRASRQWLLALLQAICEPEEAGAAVEMPERLRALLERATP